jgi:hypothetical protein
MEVLAVDAMDINVIALVFKVLFNSIVNFFITPESVNCLNILRTADSDKPN